MKGTLPAHQVSRFYQVHIPKSFACHGQQDIYCPVVGYDGVLCFSVKDSNCGEDFKHESVSTTSMFFAKSTVQFIMYETNIIEFVENSAASVYECPIQ